MSSDTQRSRPKPFYTGNYLRCCDRCHWAEPHYCRLRARPMKNMDVKTCRQWQERGGTLAPFMTEQPTEGTVLLALKSSRKLNITRGKYYVYGDGELRSYSSRSVIVLLNGNEICRQPGLVERAEVCPFCHRRIWEAASQLAVSLPDGTLHDGRECAHRWDAAIKKYCRVCGADLVKQRCPNGHEQ